MANTIVQGYQQYFGQKIECLFEHAGPASYANITTSSGKGDVIKASDFGVGGFDKFDVLFRGYSYSGNYLIIIFTTSSGTTPAISPASGSAFPQVALGWYTTSAAFGTLSTEVTNGTNLSAETIRCEFLGV